jgi:hypothetical protein
MRGIAIIQNRKKIIEWAIRSAIEVTFPEDWTLFRDVHSGRITAYLGDAGCKRCIGIWQIQAVLKNDGPNPERTELGEEFAYTYRADAYCRLTDLWVHEVEGTRFSTDAVAQQIKNPIEREFRVKQWAKANLEGNCVRRLGTERALRFDDVWKAPANHGRCAWERFGS